MPGAAAVRGEARYVREHARPTGDWQWGGAAVRRRRQQVAEAEEEKSVDTAPADANNAQSTDLTFCATTTIVSNCCYIRFCCGCCISRFASTKLAAPFKLTLFVLVTDYLKNKL